MRVICSGRRRLTVALGLVFLVGLGALVSVSAQGTQRVAVAIGNDGYRNFSRLTNCGNDAVETGPSPSPEAPAVPLPTPSDTETVPPSPSPGVCDGAPGAPKGMTCIGKNVQGHWEYRNEKDDSVMVYIPAGEFLMGTTPKQVKRLQTRGQFAYADHGTPQRWVHLDAYFIDKHQVTVGQYRRFLKESGHAAGYREPGAWTSEDWAPDERFPATCLTWTEARWYADWAGKALPTEAQWEKAARGGDGREYPWGDEWDPAKCNSADRVSGKSLQTVAEWKAWWDGFAKTAFRQRTDLLKPVGSYPDGASPYGVMDMAGNVWEWCADWHEEGYYAKAPSRNPGGPDSGTRRVVRGGGWAYYWNGVRAATRDWYVPDVRSGEGGFRCARTE